MLGGGVLGTSDFHAHIRLKPILKLCKRNYFKNKNIIEIGCGGGIIAFEFLKEMGDQFHYTGIDLDKKNIACANKIRESVNGRNLNFICADAFDYLETMQKKKIDIVILYDFLEHIKTPEIFLKELDKRIHNPDVIYLISVPTHKYRKVFGEDFHKRVGHVVDGYNKKEMERIFSNIGKKTFYVSYNTGLIGNIGAYLFYNLGKSWNPIVKELITKPFILFDINSASVSSSMFLIFK